MKLLKLLGAVALLALAAFLAFHIVMLIVGALVFALAFVIFAGVVRVVGWALSK